MERLPTWRRLVYCGGSAGFSTLDNIFGAWLIYFLLPPAESGLPQLVSNEVLFLGMTVTGLIVLFGRAVDAVADPLIAHWSDRSTSRWGRRGFFILTGSLPFALTCALLFVPPDGDGISHANGWYIAVMLGLYFFFYTYYITPYLALIPDLTRGHADRLQMTALQAFFLIIGAVLSLILIPALRAPLAEMYGEGWGFRLAIFAVVVIAFLLMIAVVPAVDEKRYAKSQPAQVDLWSSMRATIADRTFVIYVVALILYWFCFMMFRPVIPYFPEVMLDKEPGYQMILMAVLFGGAAIFFALLGMLAKRLSNKMLMLTGLLSFAVLSGLSYFLGEMGDQRATLALGYMFLLGYPVAVLLVVPNAIVSDISELSAHRSGQKREGMYFGAQGLLQKVNYGISVVVLAYLFATYGKDVANPLGVQLAGPVGAVFAFLGFLVFLKFPQRQMSEELARYRSENSEVNEAG